MLIFVYFLNYMHNIFSFFFLKELAINMGKGNENLDQDVILKFIQVNCRLYFHRKLLFMQY